ncbi:di-trans,poly-cis-decaprenylcistransferase [Candidatus Woesearchaeota archaeon]|nr:di-trans,poly-cis-decaprenylcistransferase [Candidatus Woesearchaeota archaeon]
MLEKFRRLIAREKGTKPLMHVAVTMNGIKPWSDKQGVSLDDAYKKGFEILNEIIGLQSDKSIPILTVYLMPENIKDKEQYPVFLAELINFFSSLGSADVIHQNKTKISILGKWYDLPGRVVEPIKKMIEETKDYDGFFLNFCINYDGQEEIVDACKLIARQIKANRVDVDAITKKRIKENTYSSYFVPPDIIIKNGKLRRTAGILLWDSTDSELYFTEKDWPEFTKSDFLKAVGSFNQ